MDAVQRRRSAGDRAMRARPTVLPKCASFGPDGTANIAFRARMANWSSASCSMARRARASAAITRSDAADAFVIPPGEAVAPAAMSADFRLLHVTTARLDCRRLMRLYSVERRSRGTSWTRPHRRKSPCCCPATTRKRRSRATVAGFRAALPGGDHLRLRQQQQRPDARSRGARPVPSSAPSGSRARATSSGACSPTSMPTFT